MRGTYLVVSVSCMLLKGGFADGEEECLTTGHAHDVFGCLVDLFLRLGLATGRLGIAFAFLLRPANCIPPPRKQAETSQYNESYVRSGRGRGGKGGKTDTYFAPLPMLDCYTIDSVQIRFERRRGEEEEEDG